MIPRDVRRFAPVEATMLARVIVSARDVLRVRDNDHEVARVQR